MAVEVVLFVSNSALSFNEIEAELGTDPFELWKACDFFINFDKGMPMALKTHLLDLEVTLISEKLWKEPNYIQMISDMARSAQKSRD